MTVLACGSRTGLFTDEDGTIISFDGGVRVGPDGAPLTDGGHLFEDGPNTLDARPPVDVYRNDCPDAAALLVYTIADDYTLQSFNPETGQFRTVGSIKCGAGPFDTPFSMAVDRRGTAYVLFTDRNIYKVSTATGACVGTSFVGGTNNFNLFGMGFATNSIGPTETLYIAGDADKGATGIARVDTNTFGVTVIGDPGFSQGELTGTGDGRLFAFYRQTPGDSDSWIGEIDTTNGQVLGERHFPTVDQGRGWAFAFWGGDFYMFHAPNDHTIVTRWRPADDSVTDVAQAPAGVSIVGAGVSTCAPQN
jgi:hypothetical protein